MSPMLKVLSAALLLSLVATGCSQPELKTSHTTEPTQQQPAKPSETTTAALSKPEQKSPKDRLFEEFSVYQKRVLNGDPTLYDLYMLSDRYNGLEALKWEGVSIADFAANYQDQIKKALDHSPVSFAHTVSGVHFVAISYPYVGGSAENDLINQVRGTDDELDFLTDMSLYHRNERLDSGYSVLDVYVEDLQHPDAVSIPVDAIEVVRAHEEVVKSTGFLYGDTALEPAQDPGLEQILKKYNRTLGNPKKLINKAWNVLLFDPHAATSIGSGHLVVEFEGQHNYLFTHW